jgi:threonine dehydratase
MAILMETDLRRQIEAARARITPFVRRTELALSPEISKGIGARVYLKWENHQPTGSFKIRGAGNKIMANLQACREKGVTAASTGNHGLAVASICQKQKLNLSLFLPDSISSLKRQKLEETGARIVFVDGPCEQAEAQARAEARLSGGIFVSPYNDYEVIAGQGTCGQEIMEDLPEVEEVVVPVGGGGLISGIAVYLKNFRPAIKVTGVEPENSAFIKNSLNRGVLTNDFPEKPTVAEAVAGGLEEGAITFDLIKKYVDQVITVKEEAIYQAIKLLFKHHQKKIEGAGALALAGMISYSEMFSGKKVVAVVSGGNIEDQLWEKIINS